MPRIIPIEYQRLVCIAEKAGFVYSRTKGDHLIYAKPDTIRPLVIPKYHAIPVFVIKNLMRTMNIDREKYFDLLREC